MHVRLILFQTGPLFHVMGESYGGQAKWQTLFFFFNDVSMEQLTNLWFGASLTTFLILDYLILLIFGLDSLGDITDRPGLGLPKPHSYIPLPATSIKELFSYIPVQRMPK